MNEQDIEIYKKMISPIFFIEKMWKLTPQPIKEEFKNLVHLLIEEGKQEEIRARYFEKFEKGKHITWQQWLILTAIERAVQKKGKRRITIRSGHGIGKSGTLAMLVIWYLFRFKYAQVPCTAPTADQMHDILWKEIKKWLMLMPKEIADKYEWTTGYVRIAESPETWFARAKTARKENPEALAGVHGDYVMYIGDEASGIPEEIFNTAEGSLTGENVLVVLISNPTRLLGYFYDSHHKDKENWQALNFSSEESPIVDPEYMARIIQKHGADSDEYRIRVLGEFPREDTMDNKGYIALFSENDIRISESEEFIGKKRLGIDPAGEGDDLTTWVLRDNFKAKIVGEEKTSDEKTIAQKTMTLMEHYGVEGSDVYLDNFGVGANVAQELALAGIRINALNVGEEPDDPDMFLNLRAEACWREKQWFRNGGELVDHKGWDEILTIRYRKTLANKMQIMGKLEMRKEGIKSPNYQDGLMLTFTKRETTKRDRKKRKQFKAKSLIGL